MSSPKQDSLFAGSDLSLEREYKNFLETRGYHVVKLKKSTKNITIGQVVEYFYSKLQAVSGTEVVLAARLSDGKDFKAVSRFQEKGKKVGLTKPASNETLLDLISMIFKYYEDTGKKCPISDLSYALSQRGAWVVQMSVQHARRSLDKWEQSAEAESVRRDIYSDVDSEVFKGLQDAKHRKILEKEGNNDKEKNDDEEETGS